MALEIITAGDYDANVKIYRGELRPTCHCIHPIHIQSYDIGLIRENIALEIVREVFELLTLRYPVITCEPNVSVNVAWALYKLTFI